MKHRSARTPACVALCIALASSSAALAADATQRIKGQWRYPQSFCRDAVLTVAIDGAHIAFDWMWDRGAKSQREVERIDRVTNDVIETTTLAATGDEQEDKPGDRFRYTLRGEELYIESMPPAGKPAILVRCGVSA